MPLVVFTNALSKQSKQATKQRGIEVDIAPPAMRISVKPSRARDTSDGSAVATILPLRAQTVERDLETSH